MNIDDIKNLLKFEGNKVTLTSPDGRQKTPTFFAFSQKNGNDTFRVKYPDWYDDIFVDDITSVKVTITIDIDVKSLL